jgi:hypothetical protein
MAISHTFDANGDVIATLVDLSEPASAQGLKST